MSFTRRDPVLPQQGSPHAAPRSQLASQPSQVTGFPRERNLSLCPPLVGLSSGPSPGPALELRISPCLRQGLALALRPHQRICGNPSPWVSPGRRLLQPHSHTLTNTTAEPGSTCGSPALGRRAVGKALCTGCCHAGWAPTWLCRKPFTFQKSSWWSFLRTIWPHRSLSSAFWASEIFGYVSPSFFTFPGKRKWLKMTLPADPCVRGLTP